MLFQLSALCSSLKSQFPVKKKGKNCVTQITILKETLLPKINESAIVYFLIQAFCYELKWMCYLNLHHYSINSDLFSGCQNHRAEDAFAQKQGWDDNAADV